MRPAHMWEGSPCVCSCKGAGTAWGGRGPRPRSGAPSVGRVCEGKASRRRRGRSPGKLPACTGEAGRISFLRSARDGTGRENPGTPRDTRRGPRGCRGGTRAAWVLFADVGGHGFRGRQNSVPKDTRALLSSWWTDKQMPQADPAQKRCRLGTPHLQSLTPAQRRLNLQGLAGKLRGAEVNTGLVSTRFESMPLVTLSH